MATISPRIVYVKILIQKDTSQKSFGICPYLKEIDSVYEDIAKPTEIEDLNDKVGKRKGQEMKYQLGFGIDNNEKHW